MYDSNPVEVATSIQLEAVWQEVKTLNQAEKAELVKRLLGKESGLILVSKHIHLVEYIIAQMNLLSPEGLAYVLQAIIERMDYDTGGSSG